MILALSLGGCSTIAGIIAGPDRVAPENPKRVGPAILVAAGRSAGGDYRGWVCRTNDGMTCLDVSVNGGGGGSCGSDMTVGLSVSSGTGMVTTVSGGVASPDAVTVVVHSDDPDVTAPVSGAAEAIAPGVKFFVAVLPEGATPTTVDVLDANRAVIQTLSAG